MMSVTRGDLAKMAAMSGVPGVKHSKLLKAAETGKEADGCESLDLRVFKLHAGCDRFLTLVLISGPTSVSTVPACPRLASSPSS